MSIKPVFALQFTPAMIQQLRLPIFSSRPGHAAMNPRASEQASKHRLRRISDVRNRLSVSTIRAYVCIFTINGKPVNYRDTLANAAVTSFASLPGRRNAHFYACTCTSINPCIPVPPPVRQAIAHLRFAGSD